MCRGDKRRSIISATGLLTIQAILARTTEFFQSKGIRSARLDAELLIGEALGMERLKLYLNFDKPLSEQELASARELVRRRAAREPVAYILNRREFLSRSFEVGPGVLIPRPETELLVEHAVEELRRRWPEPGGEYHILEFGAGSGAIAVSLAAELSVARVTATEISADAAAFARRNADAHGVGARVEVRLQPDFAGIEGPFHALISNPPYVDPATRGSLEEDVVKYEPPGALFADEGGLRWYRFLCAECGRLLAPGGFLLVEIGLGQLPDIRKLAEVHGLSVEYVGRDYAGIERVVRLGRKLVEQRD